jgi:hypothetical protein
MVAQITMVITQIILVLEILILKNIQITTLSFQERKLKKEWKIINI